MFDEDDVFHPERRREWRVWLEHHRRSRSQVWLAFWRAGTGKRGLTYADAVEEALCFGWIDSTRRNLDEERWVQRFTPRRPGSPYSQANRERLAVLLDEGEVCQDVETAVAPVSPEDYEAPEDILAALRADADAWANWQSFSPAYRRIRAAYVETARTRGDAYTRRLNNLVSKTAKGKQFGCGIERFFVCR